MTEKHTWPIKLVVIELLSKYLGEIIKHAPNWPTCQWFMQLNYQLYHTKFHWDDIVKEWIPNGK